MTSVLSKNSQKVAIFSIGGLENKVSLIVAYLVKQQF